MNYLYKIFFCLVMFVVIGCYDEESSISSPSYSYTQEKYSSSVYVNPYIEKSSSSVSYSSSSVKSDTIFSSSSYYIEIERMCGVYKFKSPDGIECYNEKIKYVNSMGNSRSYDGCKYPSYTCCLENNLCDFVEKY